ncbi:hypothetical protein GLOIN_2v1788324 [Rhizophagus irregularis DAOM 181602=DAOM 197198]|nr:hypothetical protein GLOIN_2v1788324 [Rhizophagus irregularis DAOM 181602=DAOM 197198]
MEGNSNQNGSSSSGKSSIEFRLPLLENISNTNCILLELEQDGFITPDKKAEELIKNLSKLKYLFALKLLFENPFNQFSDEVLRNSLVALADPTHFDYYGKQSMIRLELHIRTWIAVLEKICVTPMRLSKKLRDKAYSSLAKFAEIHKKTTQVMQEGIDNNFRSGFNQFNQLHDNKEDKEMIANEMTCPIGHEPTDKLCVLKCQHILSFNSLKKLKQKNCPECRENIEDNDIRYLPQNVIYKHLYSQFFESGHILPSTEKEDSTNINHYDSDSSDSEVDLILTKKKKFLKVIKFNSNISLKSIFQIGRKRHQTYLSAIRELKEKNYKNAEHWCKEFLKIFPKSYSMRCILAYTYRCLNDYKQAYLYINEAIKLKGIKPIAWHIRGEIQFKQGNYNDTVRDLTYCNVKTSNSYTMLGISYYNNNYSEYALKNFNIALQNDPDNYLCLKYCAYIYEKQGKFSDNLKMLDKLLNIDEKDSLILCYYGEILSKMEKYNDAILYFTEAANIDPENIHILNRRAIGYFALQEYKKALSDFNSVIQLDNSNILAYYCKGLIYIIIMEDNSNSMAAFKKCVELDPNNDIEKMYLKDSSNYLSQISNIDYNLKCSPNYHNLIAEINQFANVNQSTNINNHDKSLLFMRCKINIELEKYEDAASDLDRLFVPNEDILLVYLLQKYSDFWLYLCKSYFNNFVQLGITSNYFDLYMYREQGIYFMSNLMKFNYNYQFQKSNLNRRTLSLKNNLRLPKFSIADIFPTEKNCYDIIWKINIKKIISSDCFIRFVVEKIPIYMENREKKHVLTYEDLLELEGLGWILYVPLRSIYLNKHNKIQLSIETKKDSIDMQIEYVRIIPNCDRKEKIYFPKMDHLIPSYTNNIPETFKDKYFLRKETENLLELKDIISSL